MKLTAFLLGASAVAVSEAAKAVIDKYPGYAGDLTVTGEVTLTGTLVPGELTTTYKLNGLPKSATGGLHIHVGTSCKDKLLVGDHYYNTVDDDWNRAGVGWVSDANGVAEGSFTVSVNLALAEQNSHAVVVHAGGKERVGCGLVAHDSPYLFSVGTEKEKVPDTFKPYPGYTGGVTIKGGVTVTEAGDHVTLQWGFTAPPSSYGGIHIHAGSSCSDAGLHYFTTPEDPWNFVSWRSDALGSAVGWASVAAGIDLASSNKRTVVVHLTDTSVVPTEESPRPTFKIACTELTTETKLTSAPTAAPPPKPPVPEDPKTCKNYLKCVKPGKGNKAKVGICHSTSSYSNPYVFICVDDDAVPAHLDGTGKGHSKPDVRRGEWGDVRAVSGGKGSGSFKDTTLDCECRPIKVKPDGGIEREDTPEKTEDPKKTKQPRKVKFESEGKQVQIRATDPTLASDVIHFHVNTDGDGAQLMIQYHPQKDESLTKWTFRVKFSNVVEFLDSNGNNFPDDTEIKSTFTLDKSKWRAFPKVTDEDATKVHTFTATTTDGVFSVIGHYSGNPNLEADPNAIKFDVNVTNFPYTADGTKLALQARFRSKSYPSDRQNFVTTTDGDQSGKFAWVPKIACDGTLVDVVDTAFEPVVDVDPKEPDEQDSRKYFVFATNKKCKTLFWDPTLASTYSAVDSSKPDQLSTATSTFPGAAVWSAMALALAAAFARRG